MKDKKFKPVGTGKSYNFDTLAATKKPFTKESPLSKPFDKNKLYSSNDFESERSKIF